MSLRMLFVAVLFIVIGFPASGMADTLNAETVTGMEFIPIKGGCFEMGDSIGDGDANERPVREVCVNDFSIGKHEVTNEQFRKFRS